MFREYAKRPSGRAADGWRVWRVVVAAGLVATASDAFAQDALERNPPPAVERGRGAIVVDEAGAGSTDDTPLGVGVTGIRLIGPDDAVSAHAAAGITIGNVEDAPDAAIRAALQPYLGRPLSLALISQAQAAATDAWRDAGHPFVSVTVPPQEITSGVLQLRVVEFRAGSVTVSGTNAERGDRILRSVRTHTGDRIDSRALSEDIDWLNRVGQRSVKAVFAPGDEFGRSDLTLEVTEGRNPSVFAGWSNTGSRATGTQRIFAGISAWIPELNDTTFDYQLTGSPDLWANPRRIVPATGDYPQYVSHSARLVIPTWPRQALEISPGWVGTRETPSAVIAIENATFELPVIYRSAVSNILPGVHAGDIYGGVEFKKLYRTTLFGGAVAATGEAGLFQLVLGWANGIEDAHGSTQFDFSLRANPGGVVGGNTGANWASFSGGRVTSVNYLYGSGGVTRVTLLPGDLVWVSRASGLLAGQPLPDTERLALGGFYAVRGYDIDDAAVDLGVVWRNELRLTGLTLFGGSGFSDRFSPYLFGDIGHGRDLASGAVRTLGSAGVGFDYSIPGHLSASLAAAYAFSTGAVTGAGSVNVQAQLALRY